MRSGLTFLTSLVKSLSDNVLRYSINLSCICFLVKVLSLFIDLFLVTIIKRIGDSIT